MNKNKRVEFYRVVVIRDKTRGDLQFTARRPLMPTVRVPVIGHRGFDAIDYHWDGQETTVSGLPVYR